MSNNPFADPYQPPQPLPSQYIPFRADQKPAVWFWYVGYCMAMALIYLACIGIGGVLIVGSQELAEDESEAVMLFIQGIVFAAIGVILFLLYAAAPFLPRSKFAWIYGFVTIGIGFTSCCVLPFSIALLIQWLNPELKAYLNVL